MFFKSISGTCYYVTNVVKAERYANLKGYEVITSARSLLGVKRWDTKQKSLQLLNIQREQGESLVSLFLHLIALAYYIVKVRSRTLV